MNDIFSYRVLMVQKPLPHILIHTLVVIGGMAALSWEMLWQIKASLALGVSAWGTALTLAATMGGMTVGALAMGRLLKNRTIIRPVRLYGILEAIIGFAGLCLETAFRAVETLDTQVYALWPEGAALIHILGIVAALGVPTICMGATLPVLGLVAREWRTSIAVLYGLNTLGAACGTLLAAFLLIPQFGIMHAAWVIAAANLAVCAATWFLRPGEAAASEHHAQAAPASPELSPPAARLIVLATGFATFALEIAWFRSLTAAFKSTTDAFAIMLAVVLAALGIAARLVPFFRKRTQLYPLVILAGICILCATPLLERFDLFWYYAPRSQTVINWFVMTFLAVGPAVMLLGMALPWILDERRSSHEWGTLYALNTFAAIAGSLLAAWLLLPTIGFARTAWLAGILVAGAGISIAAAKRRPAWIVFAVWALVIAVIFESGAGRTRIQGMTAYKRGASASMISPSKILEFHEGPESTVSALEYNNGGRVLMIDGFWTAGQAGTGEPRMVNYMAWMGHLPMLLHTDPKNALVICFGTGQTSNAVRKENPQSLDIVDINPRVLKLAHNFPANEGVLDDPRVHTTVMDGRSYMRRTQKIYDVITLEPMPPNFAGVNALYSQEFYRQAHERLGPQGIIAQWLPFHLVSPPYMASIVRTFWSIFPNAAIWIDPVSGTGILLGTKDARADLGTAWPGFARNVIARNLSESVIREALWLGPAEVKRYVAQSKLISDDNQLLAYGDVLNGIYDAKLEAQNGNIDLLKSMKKHD